MVSLLCNHYVHFQKEVTANPFFRSISVHFYVFFSYLCTGKSVRITVMDTGQIKQRLAEIEKHYHYLPLLNMCKWQFISSLAIILYLLIFYQTSTNPLLSLYYSSTRWQEDGALFSLRRIKIPIKGKNCSHLGNKTFPAWEYNIPTVGTLIL